VIALHDASNIAAVIVEPFSGSAGVVIRPWATCSACARSARKTTSC
jgi:adenosylmethionine-8-amino-7-oxononanoate aminotransferase